MKKTKKARFPSKREKIKTRQLKKRMKSMKKVKIMTPKVKKGMLKRIRKEKKKRKKKRKRKRKKIKTVADIEIIKVANRNRKEVALIPDKDRIRRIRKKTRIKRRKDLIKNPEANQVPDDHVIMIMMGGGYFLKIML